jgi:hypothetical protein
LILEVLAADVHADAADEWEKINWNHITWIIHKIVTKNTYLSENSKGEIEKSYEE